MTSFWGEINHLENHEIGFYDNWWFSVIKYIETKKVISLLLVVIKESKKFQMKAMAFLGLLMNYAVELLICILMNINEIIENEANMVKFVYFSSLNDFYCIKNYYSKSTVV